MKISLPIKSLMQPSFVSMAAVLASLAAWLFPSFGVFEKGYDNPSRVDLTAVVVLSSWYLLIFMTFTLGQKLGGLAIFHRKAHKSSLFDLKSNLIYYCFTVVSTIGIATQLAIIFRSLSLQEAIAFISLGETNELKDALYSDYSIGFVSLRYVVLYSASIALYRIIRCRQFTLINISNVLMLALSTFLSFRLIFIATLLTTVFILSFGRKTLQISVPKLVISGAFLFLILSLLNFSRNADYYGRNNESFGTASVSEILKYLGSPFQAEITSARVTDQLVAGGIDAYRKYVVEDINLMTNSAFVGLHQQMGYFCWAYVALLCLFMGFIFEALASLGRTIFLLPCGAILYASAELWRLDLFQQGTFIVWFVIGVGLPVFMIVGQRLLVFIGSLRKVSLAS